MNQAKGKKLNNLLNEGFQQYTFVFSLYNSVLSCHSIIDKTKVLKTGGNLMQVESITECSLVESIAECYLVECIANCSLAESITECTSVESIADCSRSIL